MDFKRSLWGYSPEQVNQLIDERNTASQSKRLKLENDLELINQSNLSIDQLLEQIRAKCKQAYERQQIILSSKPILDLFVRQCQDYASHQIENDRHRNDTVLAELAQKTAQIDADQNKLIVFWQTLHSKLSDLLSEVEQEESSGKSLLNAYMHELEPDSLDSDTAPIQNNEFETNQVYQTKFVYQETESAYLEAGSAADYQQDEQEINLTENTAQEMMVTEEEAPSESAVIVTEYVPITIETDWETSLQAQTADQDQPEITASAFTPNITRFDNLQPDSPPAFDPFNKMQPVANLVADTFSVNLQPAESSSEANPNETETIPTASEDFVQEMTAEIEPSSSTAKKPQQQVLVMDGDVTILAMLRIILKRDGFQILECTDGYQASQNIDRMDPPQLVILATGPATSNCLGLVRRIRNKPEWDHCAIILLAENSNSYEISALLDAGANEYISKPVNTRELVSRIRNLTGVNVMAQ